MLKFVVLAVLLGLGPVSLPAAEASFRTETPVAADTFTDTVGINIHLHNGNTVYGNFPLILAALRDLGIRHTRDGLINTTWEEYYKRHASLAAIGIKCLFITGADDTREQLLRFIQKTSGAVEGFEAPNEFDRTGGPDWAAKLSEYMPQLKALADSSSPAGRLTVVGPSLTTADGYLQVPKLAASFDEANMHNYFGGRNPGTHGWGENGYGSIAWNLAGVEKAWGTKPVVTTETGYLTDIRIDQSINEAVQAEYVPRIFLEQFLHGIRRTYLYELADGNSVIAQIERSYGLLRDDGTRKPAFESLQRLVRLVSDPGPPTSLHPLDVKIDASNPDLHHLLLQRRDGTFLLAVWLEVPTFDQNTRRPLTVNAVPFKLTTRTPIRLARVFSLDPKQPEEGTALSGGRDVTLSASPAVSILQFRLAQ